MGEWMSVENGLPEVGEDVLCFGCDIEGNWNFFTGCVSIGYCPVSGDFTYLEMYDCSVATHWMPLPEPPTKELG